MSSRFLTFINLVCAFLLSPQWTGLSGYASASEAPIDLKTYATHSQMTFSVNPGTKITWTDTDDGKSFEILFHGLDLVDFGVPFSHEKTFLEKLNSLRGVRLKSMNVQQTDTGVKMTGIWKFPEGEQALANPKMERFDYRLNDPPLYVVDFWLKEGPTVPQMKAITENRQKRESLKQAEEKAQKKIERRLAASQLKKEAADTVKFCRENLTPDNTVFLPFRPARKKIDYKKWFPTLRADLDFDYFIPQNESEVASHVRVALELYNNANYALVLKTLDFLEHLPDDPEKQRVSNEMEFLKANVLIRLGYEKKGEKVLKELTQSAKKTEIGIKSALYLVGKALSHDQFLKSIDLITYLTRNYEHSKDYWVYQLAAAEAFFELKDTKQAEEKYQWLVKNAKEDYWKAFAAFRLGDLYLDRKLYPQALANFYNAFKEYESFVGEIPEAILNRAETLYWLGQYDRSEKMFKEFLEKNPINPSGWRATYRLAEIYGRKDRTSENMTHFKDWLLTTVNKYPYAPGATLARMRLIPCGENGGFDVSATKKFFEREAQSFASQREVSLTNFKDFWNLSYIQSMVSLGREDLAVELVAKSYSYDLRQSSRRIISNSFEKIFRKEVLQYLDHEMPFKALAFYDHYKEYLPPKSINTIPDYILKLSRVAAGFELGDLSSKLIDHYNRIRQRGGVVNRILASAEKSNDIDSRILKSEELFTQALSEWVTHGVKSKDKIFSLLRDVSDESQFSILSEVLKSVISDQEGNTVDAIRHASKANALATVESAKFSREDRQYLTNWLAQLSKKNEDWVVSVGLYKRLEELLAEKPSDVKLESLRLSQLGLPKVPTAMQVAQFEIEILEKLEDWKGVISALDRAEKQGITTSAFEFAKARALLRLGDADGKREAKKILEGLVNKKSEVFWKRLAQEELALLKG